MFGLGDIFNSEMPQDVYWAHHSYMKNKYRAQLSGKGCAFREK